MIRFFYEKVLLCFPKIVLAVLFSLILLLGFQATKLEVDASAETLLLEDDSDLQFFREVASRYPAGLDMLVISFAPNDDLLSPNSITAIEKISDDFKKLDRVESVMNILEVPLLENGGGIKELIEDTITLKSLHVNKEKARQELLTSPMYSQNLVSKDLKTTSILVYLKNDEKYFSLLENRNRLRAVVANKNHTKEDKKAFEIAAKEFKDYRDNLRVEEKQFVNDARVILKNNKDLGVLFLGGVSMIAVDMITFVKNDIVQFGATLFMLLAVTLWIIFRQFRYVFFPLFICILSIITTTGLLGLFGWEVTVISSNFISLQLILTISIVLHLIVMYRELLQKFPKASQKQLVLVTVLNKLNPSFFAVLTTIVSFASLMLSDIRPIINLGWMMGSGIALSLIIAFIAFPAIMVLLPKKQIYTKFEKEFAFTAICAKIVDNHKKVIVIVAVLMVIFTTVGVQKLKVENSFINYFRSSTDIYKGMANIDKELGGTTPLDVIVKLDGNKEADNKNETKESIDEFDEFESEFETSKNEAQYWFTPHKMEMVTKIHNYFESLEYVGKVQSLGTLLEIGERLNDGKPLDGFELALVYNQLPDRYKDMILTPYVNIDHNELRFTMRIIDSDKNLQRNVLLNKMKDELPNIITKDEGEFRLSGAMLLYNNMLQSLYSSQIKTLGTVAIAFLIIFWPLFGSLKASIIAVISNLIPMGIVFGFMGFIGIPLDFMTITIAAISVGIGVDDAIHYIHRFKEELKKDGNYIASMYRSHNSIGYAMYYTTLVTVLGFGVLVFSNFMPTIFFGILTVVVMGMVFLGAVLLLPTLLIIFKPFKIKGNEN
ncbi:MAG: efflux RND transporter permease subunit [Campylobacteraceae bacterium]